MKTPRACHLSILMFVLCSFISAGQEYGIKHIEPPFWWAGMKTPELQIMIHGDGIGGLTPKVNERGVRITRVEVPDNQNYLFFYLDLGKRVRPGQLTMVLEKDGRIVKSVPYEIRKRTDGSALREGFNSSDVIYLITPDRFAKGDPSNDANPDMLDKPDRTNPQGRHGGDIKGIAGHLDYIADMGFTALWINPLVENNQPKASYHGYSITDFYSIDPRFGTMQDYLELSREAGERGIKLIMDMVMNHCGSNHWWMNDLPSPDWIHYPDQYKQTNHMRTTLNDPHASARDRELFENGWFVPTMPDLNQSKPLLADYLICNTIWWIEQAGLKGIRHDTHPYADPGFMNRWTGAVMSEYPRFNIVGEEWSENPAIVARWQKGSILPDRIESSLPSLMDFPVQATLKQALTEEERWNAGFIRLYETLASDGLYANPLNLVVFPDNHDIDRFFTQLDEDLDLWKLGMTFILTTRGIPQVYYGTEILMTNSIRGDHGTIRSDFPGGWPGDSRNAFTGEGLSERELEARAFLKKILDWRKNARVVHSGNLMHFAPENGIYVYFRYDNGEKVMVILNKNTEPVPLKTSRFSEILPGGSLATDILGGRLFSGPEWIIPARTPLILEIR